MVLEVELRTSTMTQRVYLTIMKFVSNETPSPKFELILTTWLVAHKSRFYAMEKCISQWRLQSSM